MINYRGQFNSIIYEIVIKVKQVLMHLIVTHLNTADADSLNLDIAICCQSWLCHILILVLTIVETQILEIC